MARITVEDCLDKVDNRFQLVLIATKRARMLSQTSEEPKVPWENDKSTVVALREIADGHIGMEILNDAPEKPENEEQSAATGTDAFKENAADSSETT